MFIFFLLILSPELFFSVKQAFKMTSNQSTKISYSCFSCKGFYFSIFKMVNIHIF